MFWLTRCNFHAGCRRSLPGDTVEATVP